MYAKWFELKGCSRTGFILAAVAGDITYAKLRAANFSWRFQRQNAAKLDRRRQEIIPERNPRSIGRLFAKQCLGGSGLICWESMHRQHSIDFIASTPGQVWKKDAVSGDLSLASVDCLVVPRYYKLATVRLQVLNNLLVSWFSVGLRRAGRIVCRKSILVAIGIRSFSRPIPMECCIFEAKRDSCWRVPREYHGALQRQLCNVFWNARKESKNHYQADFG